MLLSFHKTGIHVAFYLPLESKVRDGYDVTANLPAFLVLVRIHHRKNENYTVTTFPYGYDEERYVHG